MIFNSISFIFLFLPLALLLYYLTPMKARDLTLLILSIVFFAWGSSQYIVLVLFSLLVNYGGALVMDRIRIPALRRTAWIGLITFNLLALFVFKYLGFFFENINLLTGAQFYAERLTQPLGISFYTFQVLSYIIDVYRERFPAERNPLRLSLYLLMFPQMASGPIMRWDEIEPQLGSRKVKPALMAHGAERFTIGLFKKVFIANSMATLWTIANTADPSTISTLFAWVGILAFTLYIYFDFSGYMDMAIGIANLFGFHLQENFDFPYTAKSVRDFWRKWHMTLGRWFRDYVYIPLGGSREGQVRYIKAVFAVWLLTGLWHGASWNFVLWGLFYGFLILLEKVFLDRVLKNLHPALANLYTMLMVIVGWVLFATSSLSQASLYLRAMAGQSTALIDDSGIYYFYTYLPLFILAFLLTRPVLYRRLSRMKHYMNGSRRILFSAGLTFLFVVSIAYILNQSFSPSMYIGF